MASIKDFKLCPSGDDSFVGSETILTDLNDSDLEELSESDLATINGGVIPLAISATVKLGLVVYGVYNAYQKDKEQKR